MTRPPLTVADRVEVECSHCGEIGCTDQHPTARDLAWLGSNISHEDAAVNPNGPADVAAARKVIDREARRRHDAGLAERIAASLRVPVVDPPSTGGPCPEERFTPRDPEFMRGRRW